MKNDLKQLLPNELEEIIEIANTLLKELGILTYTNKRYQLNKRKIACPKCNNTNHISKNGTKNKTQRYKCGCCGKFFSITSKSILSHSSLNYDQLITIIDDMINIKTIQETAAETKITSREVYNIRIKILNIFGNIMDNVILEEIIEADEKYIRISLKGTRKDKMPRPSRKNGFENRTSGISDEQICIVIAIDSKDQIIAKVVGNGPASTNMIEKALGRKIKRKSILVTDSKSAYKRFAKNNDLILKQVPTKKHTVEGIYNLGNINSLISEFEIFIQNFRGISTRHLQQYVNWFVYKKKLKYTVEYMKQNKEMYNYLIINSSNTKCRDICKSKMPFDTEKMYGKEFK